MSKGLSQIIVIVLVLLIAISSISLLYVWASETSFEIYPEEVQTERYQRQRACVGIVDISDSEVTINNCGAVSLDKFIVYVDGIESQTETISILDPGQEDTISTTTINEGQMVQVTSDYSQTPVMEYIREPNINPVAKFSFVKVTDTQVQFTDESTDADGSIVSWSWDFGTGGSSNSVNPINTYLNYSNTYDVTLIVTDDRNGKSSKTETVLISSCNLCTKSGHCPTAYCSGYSCLFNSCLHFGIRNYYTCNKNPMTQCNYCQINTGGTCCPC